MFRNAGETLRMTFRVCTCRGRRSSFRTPPSTTRRCCHASANPSAGRNPNGTRSSKASSTCFGRCNTQVRYIDPDQTLSPGEFASRAATACLFENGVDASEVDLLVYGGIARENFEPATAAEVAGRLGARPLHAFDVTCACAGLVEAIHVVAGYFALHPEIKTALVCAGELLARPGHL